MHDASPTINEIAEGLGVSLTARLKWSDRGKVPERWRFRIAQEGARRGVTLTAEQFERFYWRKQSREPRAA